MTGESGVNFNALVVYREDESDMGTIKTEGRGNLDVMRSHVRLLFRFRKLLSIKDLLSFTFSGPLCPAVHLISSIKVRIKSMYANYYFIYYLKGNIQIIHSWGLGTKQASHELNSIIRDLACNLERKQSKRWSFVFLEKLLTSF